jgi:paraquat-inducible protein B
MAAKASPKVIGGFVVGAIALLVAGVIAFGGGQYFTPKGKAVLYFPATSLSGLDIGSPLTFRGVKIGSVTDVIIQYDIDNQRLMIPVYVEMELNRIQIVSGQQNEKKNIQALIDRGLRAQLVVQSLVTGQASIDLAFHPDTPAVFVGQEKRFVELPTVPSDIDMLKANLTSVLQRIAKLPLDEIGARTLNTIDSTNALMKNLNAEIGGVATSVKGVGDQATATLREAQARLQLQDGEPMQNLNNTILDTQKLVNKIDGGIDPIIADANKLTTMTLATMDEMRITLETARSSISPDSDLYFQLNRTLKEIQTTASSIRALADYVQRHPDALLLGKH